MTDRPRSGRRSRSTIGWILLFLLIVFTAFMAAWIYIYFRLVGSWIGAGILAAGWLAVAGPLWLAIRRWGGKPDGR